MQAGHPPEPWPKVDMNEQPLELSSLTQRLRSPHSSDQRVEAIPEAANGKKTRLERENGVNKLLLSSLHQTFLRCLLPPIRSRRRWRGGNGT